MIYTDRDGKRNRSCVNLCLNLISSIQSLSHVQLFVTLWTAACQASLSCTITGNLFKFTSIELVKPSNHLIICHPLIFLVSVCPRIRIFSNELALCISWPRYWSFSTSPSNEYSGVILFRIYWFDSLQSKEFSRVFSSTTVWKHQFFSIQPSLWSNSPICTTTRKTITLTTWNFVSKAMSLLFDILSLSQLFF